MHVGVSGKTSAAGLAPTGGGKFSMHRGAVRTIADDDARLVGGFAFASRETGHQINVWVSSTPARPRLHCLITAAS